MANIAPVFNSMRILRNAAFEHYMRLPKYAQPNIGHRFMTHICNALEALRQWERLYNRQFKLDAVNAALHELVLASDYIEWMTDEHMLSYKQCADLVMKREEVERQLGGIRKALIREAGQM